MKSSTDELIELVGDRRRRSVLCVLRQEPKNTLEFDELVETLHADGSTEGSADGREVALDLHHKHLPRLTDADVLTYDRKTETVRYESDADLESVLDGLPDDVSSTDS